MEKLFFFKGLCHLNDLEKVWVEIVYNWKGVLHTDTLQLEKWFVWWQSYSSLKDYIVEMTLKGHCQ